MRISASFHHASRRDKLSSDTARETIRKISFKPTNRRSSHLRPGHDRPGACRTLHRTLQGLCPGGAGFRHPQHTGTRYLAAAGAGMRARSYHTSPGEITSVGGCAQGSSMNCAYTPGRGAVPGDMPGETPAAPRPVTRTDAV